MAGLTHDEGVSDVAHPRSGRVGGGSWLIRARQVLLTPDQGALGAAAAMIKAQQVSLSRHRRRPDNPQHHHDPTLIKVVAHLGRLDQASATTQAP